VSADAGEDTARPGAEDAVRRQKARDAGLVLPLLGLALLVPPIATGLAVEGRIAGIPVVVLYVFGVWAGLILAAWRLSRRLVAEQRAPRDARAARPRTR